MLLQTNRTVLFYYPVDTLLDKVQMHSGMIARMIPNAEVNKYAFTPDETIFFQDEMAKSLRAIYGLCHRLSIGITDALVLNDQITIGSTEYFYYAFYINNNEGYNLNSLGILDGYIENLLIDSVLKAWWLKCGLADQYKVAVEDVRLHTTALNNALYSLYKTGPENFTTIGLGTAAELNQTITIPYSTTHTGGDQDVQSHIPSVAKLLVTVDLSDTTTTTAEDVFTPAVSYDPLNIIFDEGESHSVLIRIPSAISTTDKYARIQVRRAIEDALIFEWDTADSTLPVGTQTVLLTIDPADTVGKDGEYIWQLMLYNPLDETDIIIFDSHLFIVNAAIVG